MGHIMLLFLVPFNIFALGWIIDIVYRLFTGRPAPQESMRYQPVGQRTKVTFPKIGAFKFSLGVIMVVAFVLFVICLFFLSFLPAWLVAKVWWLLGSIAVAAFVGKLIWNMKRKTVIYFDAANRTLTVPGSLEITADQISGCEVEPIYGKAKSPVFFRPVIHYGTEQTIALGELGSKRQAEEFCIRVCEFANVKQTDSG